LQKHVFLLTGPPGIGKTTVLIKTVEALKANGVSVGGMISREARVGNIRVGFEILSLTNTEHGWLAHVNQKYGPHVGKYHVNLQALNGVGARAITEAVEKCAVIAIDEVGPMELFSQRFRQVVVQAFDSKKPVLAVVHAKVRDRLIMEAKQREDAEIFTVTLASRESLHEELRKQVLKAL
jgi:nucleoside-triphosphatase